MGVCVYTHRISKSPKAFGDEGFVPISLSFCNPLSKIGGAGRNHGIERTRSRERFAL